MTWLPETDLLTRTERRPPLGGQGFVTRWGTTRSVWAPVDDGPPGARRILHERCLELFAPALLGRLGLRSTQGYHKCGSGDLTDSATEVRVISWDGSAWTTLLDVDGVPEPGPEEVRWFDLGGVESLGAVVQVRRAALDGVWTSWNLAEGGLVLRGRPSDVPYPTDERRLTLAGFGTEGLPRGVEAVRRPGEVRFRTPSLQVGFRLGRPGFSFLAVDGEGTGAVGTDLLFRTPGVDLQGPALHPVGAPAVLAPALRAAVDGEVEVRGSTVTYRVDQGVGEHLVLAWTVHPDRLELAVEREGRRDLEAWESTVWRTALDGTVATAAAIGTLTRTGRTGTMPLPLLWHVPKHGTLSLGSGSPDVRWRSDADRPAGVLLGELSLAQDATDRGTALLRAGRHRAEVTWAVDEPRVRLRPGTPPPVERALRRTLLTGLTFRPDTGTLSNNAMSIHCPMTMDTWARVAGEVARVAPQVPALDLLRSSLERWLDGGPGYASGPLRIDGEVVAAEDDYLITGAGVLLGAAEYLRLSRDRAWLATYHDRLGRALADARARDLDGDGLVESPRRRGVSGENQWSTNWYDVVSFGWKDAWVNATLYAALTGLDVQLRELGAPEQAEGLADWAALLAESYRATLLNPATGWVAGWRSADGVLHDHAFPAINGAAVMSGVLEPADAERAMRHLWRELEGCAFDRSLGLPTSLRRIPDEDLTGFMQGYPHGFYLNGALSHSQSRHFVDALYRVGMTAEADGLLGQLCAGLAEGEVYAGSQSGVDWRHWDGEACGYEGLLTEQFGIVATALHRYADDGAPADGALEDR